MIWKLCLSLPEAEIKRPECDTVYEICKKFRQVEETRHFINVLSSSWSYQNTVFRIQRRENPRIYRN